MATGRVRSFGGLVLAAAVGAAAAGLRPAPARPAAGPDRLADEAAIRAVVDGIDAAVDAKDWAACRRLFADEVGVDFGSLDGSPAARIPADKLVTAWRDNLFAEKTSLHMRTNHLFAVAGDRAEVRSKGYAFNRLAGRVGSDLWEVWGDYRHTLDRTPAGWRVSGLVLTVRHARGNERARDAKPAAAPGDKS